VQTPRILVLKLFKWWGENNNLKKNCWKKHLTDKTLLTDKKQTNNQLVSPTSNRIYKNRIYNLCKEEAIAAEASGCPKKASTHPLSERRKNWMWGSVCVCVCVFLALSTKARILCLYSF
jgi:hypothetical protein